MPPVVPVSTVSREGDALLGSSVPQCSGRAASASSATLPAVGHKIGRGIWSVLGFDQEIERCQTAVHGVVGKDDRPPTGRRAGLCR